MEPTEPGKVTALLKVWASGDSSAVERLIPVVYSELHRLAQRYRRNAPAGDTLRTTALVHEAYLRLVDIQNVDWHDRVHFFAVSANLMRRILVDAARARAAAKRGGQARIERLDLDDLPLPNSERAAELIALDDALGRLEKLDPRRARVIELRVFGGLSVEEAAASLQVSPQTILRDWKLAKAWLVRELSGHLST
jgi:RNA polymerase sigma factor (TIGR02999 family)